MRSRNKPLSAIVGGVGLMVLACTPRPSRLVAMLGEEDAGGPSVSFVTDTPDAWRDRCAIPEIASQLDECAALEGATGTDAERLAFELNVKASEQAILPPGLGSLHFSHGRYAGWTAEDLRDAIAGDLAPAAVLDELAIAVNRAFVNGNDSGALAEWVTTPVCGTSESVDGPDGARCGILDHACTRGRYLETAGCCSLELEPAGTRCGDQQVCTPEGLCATDEDLPSFERVQGPRSWVDVLSGGNPFAWSLPSEGVRLSVAADGEMQPDSESPPEVAPADWQDKSGRQFGAPVAEVANDAVGAIRVRLGSAKGVVLAAAAVEANGMAEALYVANEPAEVCVIHGRRVDDLGPVLSDCSSPGAVTLACPGQSGDLSCEYDDGFAVVRGADLTMAFALDLEPEGPLRDVWRVVFPEHICAGFGCVRYFPDEPSPPYIVTSGPDSGSPCELDGGCQGIQLCISFGGTVSCQGCFHTNERCDGEDNDCDGTVDEGGDAMCDDGIPCTRDYCSGSGGCGSSDEEWGSQFCTPAFCATGICDGQDDPLGIDPTWRRSPQDANGCSLAYNDPLCEEVDQCFCNGVSVCDPLAATSSQNPVARLLGCTDRSPNATPLPSGRARIPETRMRAPTRCAASRTRTASISYKGLSPRAAARGLCRRIPRSAMVSRPFVRAAARPFRRLSRSA